MRSLGGAKRPGGSISPDDEEEFTGHGDITATGTVDSRIGPQGDGGPL